MADRIDQLTIGSTSYDIALPADSKDTMFYDTASATANAFTVSIPDVDALYTGLAINVKFNAATADGCTLKVNSLDAKRIYYRTGEYCTTHIAANMYVTLVYNGTGWVMQGSYWANTHNSHGVTVVSGKKADGSTDITASSSQTTSGLHSVTLGASGVTANAYGDSSAQTPGYGSTFKVPYVRVNAQGIVTEISEHTVKIPASDEQNTAHSHDVGTGLKFASGSATGGINSSDKVTYELKQAATNEIGGIKVSTVNASTDNVTIGSNKNYGVRTNSDGSAYVNVPWTDNNTDTSVTAVGNHYTPSGGSAITVTSSGTATRNSTVVLTGITADAAGHITGVTAYTLPASDNTNTSHSHSAGVGLIGSGSAGTGSGTYDYKVALVDETKSTNAATYTAGGSTKFYAVQLDKNDKLGVYVPWVDNDEDTHYTKYFQIKGNGTEAVKFTQDSDKSLNIKPGSNVTVSAASGEITISSSYTDTNTAHSHEAGDGLALTTGSGYGTGGISETITKYYLKVAGDGTLGGIKLGYSANGKNYPVVLDSNNKAYVNVPWTDNNDHYTYTFKVTDNAGTEAVSFAQNANASLKLAAGGATTVTKTAAGEITISSTNTWTANAVGVAGYVAAPTKANNANQVWKCDANGNPGWRDDTDTDTWRPLGTGATDAAAGNHTHTTIVGSYTSNGGQQNPNYFGTNKVGALMMNTTVNSNSQYKDWLFMDCYSGSDVGGGVAIGVNRQSLGAYIMRSAAARETWAESAELLGTHHLGFSTNNTNRNYAVGLSSGKLYVNVPWEDHTYNFDGTTFYSGNESNAEHNANNAVKNGHYYYSSGGPSTDLGASTGDGALYVQSYSDSWVGQIAQDYRNGRLFVRGKNSGTWQSWVRIANYDEKADRASANRPGVTKLYRNDHDSAYNVQTYHDGTYWVLYGYNGDTAHAGCRVAYADNADQVDGLHVHSGRNNEADKIVRTDSNGYLLTGYINSSSGDENNSSSPARIWGTNGNDSYLRTYNSAYVSVGSATNARYVIGDDNAASPGYALLQSGAGRGDASPAGDTWIYYDTLGGTSNPWGIRHDQGPNTISFIGSGTARIKLDLSNGNITASDVTATNIKNLSTSGGIYWNPYVESSSDSSDAASITLKTSGAAGGTELCISQQNDANDIINLCTNSYIYMNSKRAFNISDSWLRINENSGFSSGIYTGSSLIRSDNRLEVGSSGSAFAANSSGQVYADASVQIKNCTMQYNSAEACLDFIFS